MYHTRYDHASSNDSRLRLRGSRQVPTTAGRLPGEQERRDPWHYVACNGSRKAMKLTRILTNRVADGEEERLNGLQGPGSLTREDAQTHGSFSARTAHLRMRQDANQSDISQQALYCSPVALRSRPPPAPSGQSLGLPQCLFGELTPRSEYGLVRDFHKPFPSTDFPPNQAKPLHDRYIISVV